MIRPLPLRAAAPIVLLASASLLLAGCGSGSSGNASAKNSPSSSPSSTTTAAANAPCAAVPAGNASNAVKVSGAFGKAQTATFKAPLKATGTQRTILTRGTGKTTAVGEQVNTLVTVYLGSGKSLGTQPLTLTVGSSSIPAAFGDGAACLPLGTRSVTTASAKDVYGASGNPQAGIKASDTLVIVTDLISDKVQLVPAAWTKNTPKVTFDSSGKPTVTLPGKKPASSLELKVLKKGTGAVVKSGDTVTVEYQGTSWNTGKIFDQSYGRAPASFATDQVVPGFGAALVGQTVGSRVIVTIPPKYAYKAKSSSNTSQLAGQTLVFVIEIQSTKH